MNGQIISFLVGNAVREAEGTDPPTDPASEPPTDPATDPATAPPTDPEPATNATESPTDGATNATEPPTMMEDMMGVTHEMNTWWPMGKPFENVMANVGDSVVFRWSEGFEHNVYIHPSNNCDDTDAIWIGDEFPVMYTFTEEDYARGVITFACQVRFFVCYEIRK